jgi:hypothetical protein
VGLREEHFLMDKKTPSRLRLWVGRIARMTVFFAVCIGALLYIDYRAARASVMDRLLGLGQRMAPYLDDGRATEAPRLVRVNGVRMHVAAGATSHSPSMVKGWYQQRYAARGDGMSKMTEDLRARGVLPPEAPGLNQIAFGDERQGGLAALDFGDKLSLEMLKERLSRFVGSGDLGSIARLRYVYWEKRGEGGTRFLTVWTDEKFKISDLVPGARTDAPGSDIDGVPRFPGTVRVLSAAEQGMPQQMAVYDGTGSPATAELFYRSRMRQGGWSEDTTFATIAQKHGRRASRWTNAKGHEVVLDLSDSRDNETGVTIVALQTR